MKFFKSTLLIALISSLALCFALAIACGERASTDDGDDDAADDDSDDDANDDDDDDDDTELSDDEILALCEEYKEFLGECSSVINIDCENELIAECVVEYVAYIFEILGAEDLSLVDCGDLRHEVSEECL